MNELAGVNNLGHSNLSLGAFWRILQDCFGAQSCAGFVGSQNVIDWGRVCRGLDAVDVDGTQGVDVLDDGSQLALEGGQFFLGQIEAREFGNAFESEVSIRHASGLARAE